MQSRPLEGTRVGVVQQMMGAGVAEGVSSAVHQACQHLEALGASIEEVRTSCPCCLDTQCCGRQIRCISAGAVDTSRQGHANQCPDQIMQSHRQEKCAQ